MGLLSAQNSGVIYWKTVDYSPFPESPPIVKTDSLIVITFQDLIDYQKECYNDSTLTGGVFIFEEDLLRKDGTVYASSGRWKYYYDHSQPTFEGFIEYMEKKYKR